jgi:hypothetical protein
MYNVKNLFQGVYIADFGFSPLCTTNRRDHNETHRYCHPAKLGCALVNSPGSAAVVLSQNEKNSSFLLRILDLYCFHLASE